MAVAEALQKRKDFTSGRLGDLRSRIAPMVSLSSQSNLGIYVTGSYGRLEAHPRSDLDVFFVSDGNKRVERITKTLIDADLINLVNEMKFPPFSNDAQYLEIHSLNEMLEKLGSAEDDFKNLFTARMLLLLESRPLFGETAYNRVLTKIIDAYFRDYHDHTGDFRPLFLVNDILRFWKTLCLNYEHRRNRPQDRAQKNKHHLRNLKLKFSRLLICFSTITPLVATRNASPEYVLSLTQLAPLDRLEKIVEGEERRVAYNSLCSLYSSFLEIAAQPDILNWIGNKENRKSAFRDADLFGDNIFSILKASIRKPDDLRFLIV
jgi:predicted nucleotidyltransferase